jgi:hypothetical protein
MTTILNIGRVVGDNDDFLSLDRVNQVLSNHFEDFSMLPYDGELATEPTIIITVDTDKNQEQFERAVQRIADDLRQDAIPYITERNERKMIHGTNPAQQYEFNPYFFIVRGFTCVEDRYRQRTGHVAEFIAPLTHTPYNERFYFFQKQGQYVYFLKSDAEAASQN